MNTHETYVPGHAAGAKVQKKEGDTWTLVLVRDLRHPPAKVWEALTDPEQLRE
ncbi:MAG: polyketide cyclase, partial [Gemmatimonadaceae bacterium]